MAHFALSAVGADRPGIVAAVTRVLVDHGCNLEDTSMAILRGHFTMMLVVDGPEFMDADTLESALAGAARDFDLVVAVRAIDGSVPESPAGVPWTVAVYGADQPGIVHRVAEVLATAGVNIVGLDTRVIGEPGRPVYAMLLDVTLPDDVDAAAVTDRLGQLSRELGVECTLHPDEADIL